MAAVGRPAAIPGTGEHLSQARRPTLLSTHLATSRAAPVIWCADARAMISATAFNRRDVAALKIFDDAVPASEFPSSDDERSAARLSADIRSGRDRVPVNGHSNGKTRTQIVPVQLTAPASSRQRKSSQA